MLRLTRGQVEDFGANGFLAPIRALEGSEAGLIRSQIEDLEAKYTDTIAGRDLNQYFRVNGQIVLPLLAEIARKPSILGPVSDILGPDLLVWSVELFIKEPRSDAVVSWHQDITYWGMGETDEELTAWLALSDVTVAAGAMRFIPGSHKGRIVAHTDTFSEDNLLSRGQEIAGVNEDLAVHGPLAPGEMSFHHGRVFHASGPNRSDDRRIGCAIRYVTPSVRQSASGRDYAMPVRGADREGGWIPISAPVEEFGETELALYEEILAHQSTTLAEGATEAVELYETEEPAE